VARHEDWTAVVPVKETGRAKTRLSPDPVRRQGLALAFALDTVAALTRARRVLHVLVVTDDQAVADAVRAPDVSVVADVPRAGLNPALVHGVDVARGMRADAAVAMVSSDLPALRPPEMDAVLDACTQHPTAFVCDAAGLGTTVLTVRAGADARPHFGPRSRAAHRRVATEVTEVPAPTVRRDVDTWVDLWDARRMGVGPATTAVL
jgi:2-phospho-L-lactate guanylyltransferase